MQLSYLFKIINILPFLIMNLTNIITLIQNIVCYLSNLFINLCKLYKVKT